MSKKQCEDEYCRATAVKGERFCKDCKKDRIRKMQESGYLTPKPHQSFRGKTHRENTYETKHGTGHG